MSVAGKRSLAVAVAELRLGCDLVREAHAGPTGTAAERQDPLYIWAVQHDDHSTRQKLEAGWQLGIRQEVRMICAARQLEKALQVSVADQTSNVLGLDNAGEAPTASTQTSRIGIGNGDGIRVQNAQSFGWRIGYDFGSRGWRISSPTTSTARTRTSNGREEAHCILQWHGTGGSGART